MNLFVATIAAFVSCGLWLFSKSFLNIYYDSQEWDNYAISSLIFTAASCALSFAFAGVAVKFLLPFVL